MTFSTAKAPFPRIATFWPYFSKPSWTWGLKRSSNHHDHVTFWFGEPRLFLQLSGHFVSTSDSGWLQAFQLMVRTVVIHTISHMTWAVEPKKQVFVLAQIVCNNGMIYRFVCLMVVTCFNWKKICASKDVLARIVNDAVPLLSQLDHRKGILTAHHVCTLYCIMHILCWCVVCMQDAYIYIYIQYNPCANMVHETPYSIYIYILYRWQRSTWYIIYN